MIKTIDGTRDFLLLYSREPLYYSPFDQYDRYVYTIVHEYCLHNTLQIFQNAAAFHQSLPVYHILHTWSRISFIWTRLAHECVSFRALTQFCRPTAWKRGHRAKFNNWEDLLNNVPTLPPFLTHLSLFDFCPAKNIQHQQISLLLIDINPCWREISTGRAAA